METQLVKKDNNKGLIIFLIIFVIMLGIFITIKSIDLDKIKSKFNDRQSKQQNEAGIFTYQNKSSNFIGIIQTSNVGSYLNATIIISIAGFLLWMISKLYG